ncbi:helix-turn-helix domain-containing protein [Simplicispira sedimenti]|uniref:helix-turn-helix domain-containing protein n=1 Tax=Simplicispira sedimenti TaxID=2919500 RepID=UPI001FA970D6|nr:helix-turn-helix domain-containing protein [Acidovorax sp. W1-6]
MPLHLSIDKAANIVGSQTKLAQMLDIYPTHLSNMKAGTRPCTINTRVRIAEIAGDDPQRAIIEGLIAQLDKDDQRQAGAAAMLQSMLDAFPPES